jgi:hypothetical protein
MPIRKELRYFYPIDWLQLSAWVRFARAKGCCEVCGRPHGKIVHHLGDGRWFDERHQTWRNGRGREVAWPAYRVLQPQADARGARHGPSRPQPSNSRPGNLRALCQRCHLLQTAPSTAGASEPPSSCAVPWAICSLESINAEFPTHRMLEQTVTGSLRRYVERNSRNSCNPQRGPFGETEDGRPFGADLPMVAPEKRSEVKAGQRPPPEAARALASGLEGASEPVFCWQVWAEGPVGN